MRRFQQIIQIIPDLPVTFQHIIEHMIENMINYQP